MRPSEESASRLAWGGLGLTLLASAGLSGDLARQHMAALGHLCGAAAVPHCGWCYAAAGFALAGVSAFAAAARPALARGG